MVGKEYQIERLSKLIEEDERKLAASEDLTSCQQNNDTIEIEAKIETDTTGE